MRTGEGLIVHKSLSFLIAYKIGFGTKIRTPLENELVKKKFPKLRQMQAQEKQNLSVSSLNSKQRFFNLSKLTMNRNYREIDSSSSIFLISFYDKVPNPPSPPTRRCGEGETPGGVGVGGGRRRRREQKQRIHRCYTLSKIADLHMERLLLHDS